MENSNELFSNLPDQKYFSLFFDNKGKPNYDKVLTTLNFDRKEIAKAANVPSSSVRYDEKMPKDLEERIKQWALVLVLVAQYFQGNPTKTALWFQVPNPLLGGITPRDMIRFGRALKLLRFIQNTISENTK